MATIIICGKQQRQLGKCENIELVNYNGTKQRFTASSNMKYENGSNRATFQARIGYQFTIWVQTRQLKVLQCPIAKLWLSWR